MADFKILVVGGGIAGLAAALALRSPDREITILEASRMNKEVGALISLQPNASKIATQLGLDPFLATKGPIEDKSFRVYGIDGELKMEIVNNTEVFRAKRILYHRVDLHDALKQAVISPEGSGKPANIIVASKVRTVDCENGIVTCENGSTYEADLVIGADGIRSVVRDAVVGTGVSEPKPTGFSAYRLLMDTAQLEKHQAFTQFINPRDPSTTMVMGHDRRIIMGPARDMSGKGGDMYGVVALVPDESLHEESSSKSWLSEGSKDRLLESFDNFPSWIKTIFQVPEESPALYQLRDLDPLTTWVKGRVILIGDAAHAMLPTQGQGASQSFEDAEAIKAFLEDLPKRPSKDELERCLQIIFETRYPRASLIQAYSRQQARSATDPGSNVVKLNPTQFNDYNCTYEGAKNWQMQQQSASV